MLGLWGCLRNKASYADIDGLNKALKAILYGLLQTVRGGWGRVFPLWSDDLTGNKTLKLSPIQTAQTLNPKP